MPKDFVIHSFRHTMLTRLGEAGADAFTLMRIAGHSSVTTEIYHPSPEHLERAVERLEALKKTHIGEKDSKPLQAATVSATSQTVAV